MVSEKSLTLTLDARLTYNIIARLTQARFRKRASMPRLANETLKRSMMRSASPREAWLDRLANEIRQRSTVGSTRECSKATPRGRIISSDTPQTNHLPRCLLSAILSRDACTRYYHDTRCVHEILSRHTVTKYVHDVRLRVIQQDGHKSISQQQQMQDRHMQPSQLNV